MSREEMKTLAEDKLKKYNQEEIINVINNLSNEEKEKIYKQVMELNLDQIDNLYDELTVKEKSGTDNIEEIVAINKEKLPIEELTMYNKLGEDIIKSNAYALVTMSGGQGTRLGYDKPKGEFSVNIDPEPKFLFEILADKLIEENNKYNVTIPWYIMTSVENDKEIQHFFAEHNYFGYPSDYIKFFKQGNLPLITESKKLIIGKDKLIKEAADGNGGIFNSMYNSEVLADMEEKGIKWIFIGSIDNILLKIADTTLIGLAVDKNVEIATKSLMKNSPEEKVGAICKSDNRIKVVEYSEMSDEMKNKRNADGELTFGESHIMCNLFSINALKTLATKKLPYHIAHKKAEYLDENGNIIKPTEPNIYKFETFIVDSPQTAIELYNNYNKENKRI